MLGGRAREQTLWACGAGTGTCACENTSVNSHVRESKSMPVNVGIHVSE